MLREFWEHGLRILECYGGDALENLNEQELHRLICEANEAKERLYQIAATLDGAGCYKKAKSLLTIVSNIEYWQNVGWKKWMG